MFRSPCYTQRLWQSSYFGRKHGKNWNHDFCGLGKSTHRFEGDPKNPKTDKRFKEPDFSFNNPAQLLALIRSFLESEEELKRIYFYASEPFTEVEPRIKGNKTKNLRNIKTRIPKIMRRGWINQGLSKLSTTRSPNKIKWNYESVG